MHKFWDTAETEDKNERNWDTLRTQCYKVACVGSRGGGGGFPIKVDELDISKN